MFARLSETLKKYANGWLVLLFLAGEIFFNAAILPNQQAKIEAGSDGTGPIDLQLFYHPKKSMEWWNPTVKRDALLTAPSN